jgi:hypothetical protein
MTMSRTGLPIYLYGYDHDWYKDGSGKIHIMPRKIEKHRWGNKEIPSGFFDQPDAENVSAVVFSNSGTVSKFLRMGKLAGFGSEKVKLLRVGTAVDHDPDANVPQVFKHVVDSLNYKETWVEGLDVFHNPKAILPLEEYMFPGASHHWLLSDGQILSHTTDWHPLASQTIITVQEDSDQTRP